MAGYGEVMENYIKIKYNIEQLVKEEGARILKKYGKNAVSLENDKPASGEEQAAVL